MARSHRGLLALVVVAGWASESISAAEPTPTPMDRDRAVWPGMTPAGSVLLPNGWSLRPAGRQTTLGALPVLLALHPSEPILAVLHAGYGEHEVVTVDADSGRV